jgi:hypothetical protein
MTYDAKKDPSSPYFAGRRPQDGIVDAVRQITPVATDLSPYALDIEVQVSNGGRANIVYLPEKNADADTVTENVPSGWKPGIAIRRVVSLAAVDGGATATVFGLYDANPIEPATLGALAVSNLIFDDSYAPGTLIGNITGKTAGTTLEIVPADARLALSGDDGAGWKLIVGLGDLPAGDFEIDLRESGDAVNSPRDTHLKLKIKQTVEVLVLFSDSNGRATQDDPENLGPFTPTSRFMTYHANAWKTYVPNVTRNPTPPGYGYGTQAGAATGMSYSLADDRWAFEAVLVRKLLEANPTKLYGLIKYAAAGSFASFDSATLTPFNPTPAYISWDPTSGQQFATLTTKVLAAIADLTAQGYVPKIKLVDINLGVNDAGYSATAALVQAVLTAIIAAIRAQWPVVAGVTRYFLNRITTGQAYAAQVRAAIEAVSGTSYDIFMIDTDGATKDVASPGGGSIHYDAAGQNMIGETQYREVVSPENNLIMQLGTSALAWFDSGYGVTLNTTTVSALRDRIGALTVAQATASKQPAFVASVTEFKGAPGIQSDGVDDTLGLSSGLATRMPAGATPCWVYLLGKELSTSADATSRCILNWGGDGTIGGATPSTERRFGVSQPGGAATARRFRAQIGAGGGVTQVVADAAVDANGTHLVVYKVGATATTVSVDGATSASVNVVPATDLTVAHQQMSLFGPGSQYDPFILRHAIVTAPLNAAQEAAMLAYLGTQK